MIALSHVKIVVPKYITLSLLLMNKDLLIVGQTPPPYHGQAVVTAMLFDHDWGDMKVVRLRMSYSDSIDDVGKAGVGKILHLLVLIVKTWWIVLSKRPRILYYLPASANRAPVIRDIVYLGLVRWLFPRKVFHYHAGGLPEYLEKSGFWGRIARCVYASADVSIDVIETDPPTGRYFSSARSVVVQNGVDVNPVEHSSGHGEVFKILFVGVLNEGKGIKEIVETAKLLKDRGCRFECKLVGDWVSDVFRSEVEGLIHSENLGEFLVFTGSLSGDEKWQVYADADCFFFPSHYEAETFGMVLVEAMAFGLPLITTNWRGIPKVVRGGGCAFLCDVRAPGQYANAIMSLYDNPQVLEKMGIAARAHYTGNYTREKFVAGMEKVFRELLT